MDALSGRFRRPMGRKRLKFIPARSLRYSMPKSWSFRTVCVNSARPRAACVSSEFALPRRICAGSARRRGSPPPSSGASTRAVRRQSTLPRSPPSRPRDSARPRSPSGSRSGGRASIACWPKSGRCWRRESQFVTRRPRGGRSTLEPPGNYGVVADLCCMWRMWRMCSAEALALSLLMFARCRIWLLCDPVGAVALAAGAV